METKTCCRCKRELPLDLEHFHSRTKSTDGYDYHCKECGGYNFGVFQPNRVLKSKEGYQFCSKCRCELPSNNEYFSNEKEGKLRTSCKNCEILRYKLYREKNRIAINKRAKIGSSERHKKYYSNHKEKYKNELQERRKSNPDQYDGYTLKRNSIKKNLPSTFTAAQWRECKKHFNNVCSYCGKEERLTQDHFIPISKSGGYIKENIIPVCKSCNPSKSDKDFFEWYPKQLFYTEERESKILEYLEIDYKNVIDQ